MDIRKKTFSYPAFLTLVTTTVILAPSILRKASVKPISKVLSIQTSKMEPPRVAFDEIHKSAPINEWSLLKSKNGSFNLNEKAPIIAAMSPVQALRSKKVTLMPMVFAQKDFEKMKEDQSWVQTLPKAQQDRVRESQDKYGTLDEGWQSPTFAEMAELKIRQLKEEAKVQGTSGNSDGDEKILIEAKSDNGEVRTPQSFRTAEVQVKKEGDKDKVAHQIGVSGEIVVSGLPSGPQWQIQVARYEDDIKKEDARVDLKNSTYHIVVPELNGTLLAKLIDSNSGQVLGEGTYRLSRYTENQINGRARILLKPSNNAVTSTFGSFYNHPTGLSAKIGDGKEKPIASKVLNASLDSEGKTDDAGAYRFDQVMKGSWTLLRSEAKNFYPSIFMVQSGEEKRLPLFPEKMIHALKQILSDQAISSQVPETGSIVWGRVAQNGKPMAGIQVAAEAFENIQAVYFNALMLPDSSLSATSENGYFAFVNIPTGYQSFVATRGNQYFSHANVVVDDEAISIAEMENTLQTEKVDIKVFDALNGTPQEANLEIQSLPEQIDVKGYAQIDLQPLVRQSFLRAHATSEQYYDSTQVYNDNMDFLHVPLISRAWIANLLSTQRISIGSELGFVVGFTNSAEYEIYLGHDKEYSRENIIYFDPQGGISQKAVAGGGFVLFNVPVGVQSIVMAPLKSELLQTQVVPIDASALTVVKFR